MRSLIISLTLLLPMLVGAQGFGSFSHDQPFLAADVVSGGGEGWPQETNLIIYFDTRDFSNVVFSGTSDIVTNWLNIVSANGIATNYNTTRAPVWRTNGGPGGVFGAVEFDGSNKYLAFFPTNVAAGFYQNFTVAITFARDTSGKNTPIGAVTAASEANASFAIFYEPTYSPTVFCYNMGNRPGNRINTAGNIAENTWYTTVLSSDAGTTTRMFTNSVYVGENALGAMTGEFGRWFIGNYSLSYGNYHDGPVSRVMVWKSALTSNECVEASQKIMSQFGL